MERTTFNNDIQHQKRNEPAINGCCNDVVFAYECAQNGFSIYTDLNVSVWHLKVSTIKNKWLQELFMVGKKRQEWLIMKHTTNNLVSIS
jgi:hypothetical protein